jgi:hypothetical protein
MTTATVQAFINGIPDKRVAVAVSNIFDRISPNNTDTAITAHAGGTQAAAIPLKAAAAYHEVTTVATAADSVKLPPAKVGEFHFVKNSAAANAMQVYGSGTDTIDSVATATGVSQLAGDAVLYVCLVPGNYIRLGGVAATEAFTAITTATLAATTSVTVTSASAVALAVGLAGATNSAFVVDSSTGSQAAGLKVTGATAAGTVAMAAISSGADAGLSIAAKGAGVLALKNPVATHGTAAINATATATAAEVATGYITSTSAAATVITLPTGTLLGAALGAVQGTVHDLYIDNTAGANTVTIAVAVNGILSALAAAEVGGSGLLTVPSGVTGQARFTMMFSSATAYTFTRTA